MSIAFTITIVFFFALNVYLNKSGTRQLNRLTTTQKEKIAAILNQDRKRNNWLFYGLLALYILLISFTKLHYGLLLIIFATVSICFYYFIYKTAYNKFLALDLPARFLTAYKRQFGFKMLLIIIFFLVIYII